MAHDVNVSDDDNVNTTVTTTSDDQDGDVNVTITVNGDTSGCHHGHNFCNHCHCSPCHCHVCHHVDRHPQRDIKVNVTKKNMTVNYGGAMFPVGAYDYGGRGVGAHVHAGHSSCGCNSGCNCGCTELPGEDTVPATEG